MGKGGGGLTFLHEHGLDVRSRYGGQNTPGEGIHHVGSEDSSGVSYQHHGGNSPRDGCHLQQ